jgi:hypothetical protein
LNITYSPAQLSAAGNLISQASNAASQPGSTTADKPPPAKVSPGVAGPRPLTQSAPGARPRPMGQLAATPSFNYLSQTGDLGGKTFERKVAVLSRLMGTSASSGAPQGVSVEFLSATRRGLITENLAPLKAAMEQTGFKGTIEALVSGAQPIRSVLQEMGVTEFVLAHDVLNATIDPKNEARIEQAVRQLVSLPFVNAVNLDDHHLFTGDVLPRLSEETNVSVPDLQKLSVQRLTNLVSIIRQAGKDATVSVGGATFTKSTTGLSNAQFLRQVRPAVYEVQLYTHDSKSLETSLNTLLKEARADPQAFKTLKTMRIALTGTANKQDLEVQQMRHQQLLVAQFARQFTALTGVPVSHSLWNSDIYLQRLNAALPR